MANINVRTLCADRTCTIDRILEVVKKSQVRDINRNRKPFSEYHHLFPLLKRHETKFQTYMRMKLSTFNYILSKIYGSLTKNWCNLHQDRIEPEEKLVVAIRFLATGASYSDLSFAFLMGKSTLSYLIEDVLTALWTVLQPLHMPIPTKDLFMNVAQEFYFLWDVPNCIGCIDVRHIRIKRPAHSGSLYFNYKKFYSIALQAVVDANYKFIVIDVGGYGHQHDARTFRNSTLYRGLKDKKLEIPEEDELYNSHTVLPYFFIGDGAYPLSANLMKPYPGRQLSQQKRFFNKRLSRARVTVECAFGHLCQKWRIFYGVIQHSPEKTELITKAACILQNVIIDLEKPKSVVSTKSFTDASVLVGDDRETDNVLTGDGQIVRSKLMQFFIQNPI